MPKGIFLQLDVDYVASADIARLRRYGRDARALRDLLVQMWCYCKRHQSDGNVPAEEVGVMVYPDPVRVAERDAAKLVEVGLAERTDTGYYLPHYLRHNPSRAQIADKSKKTSEAGRIGGLRSGEVRRGEAPPKHGASVRLNTETETETQVEPEPSDKPLSGDRPVTLELASATKHPCTRHPLGDGGDACGGCRSARLWDERELARDRDRRERERTQAFLDEQRAAAAAARPRPKEIA